jgi:hypothetical protein
MGRLLKQDKPEDLPPNIIRSFRERSEDAGIDFLLLCFHLFILRIAAHREK